LALKPDEIVNMGEVKSKNLIHKVVMKPFKPLYMLFLTTILSCNNNSTNTNAKGDSNTIHVTYTNHDSASGPSTLLQKDSTMSLIFREMIKKVSSEQDYSKMMISYDKAVIEMIEQLLSKSKDEELKGFATKALKARRSRIEALTRFYKSDSIHVSPQSPQFQKALKVSITHLQPNKDVGRNIDKDFVSQLSQIEGMATTMAEAELDYGSQQSLKAISLNIINQQNEDLSWLNSWDMRHQEHFK
jgi:uncharacterized protein (DUF305 family)